MLALADKGDNSSVDMLVGDIYGQDYQKIGLKSSTIASSFGKVFRRGEGHGAGPTTEDEEEERRRSFKSEDISRSLLYAISNNIGQIACVCCPYPPRPRFFAVVADARDGTLRRYMNAEKHNLDRIYFGGGFIRGASLFLPCHPLSLTLSPDVFLGAPAGHAATISTLSYAIRFWSKGTKRALFLRHEGYLGGIGAWLKNIGAGAETPAGEKGEEEARRGRTTGAGVAR